MLGDVKVSIALSKQRLAREIVATILGNIPVTIYDVAYVLKVLNDFFTVEPERNAFLFRYQQTPLKNNY